MVATASPGCAGAQAGPHLPPSCLSCAAGDATESLRISANYREKSNFQAKTISALQQVTQLRGAVNSVWRDRPGLAVIHQGAGCPWLGCPSAPHLRSLRPRPRILTDGPTATRPSRGQLSAQAAREKTDTAEPVPGEDPLRTQPG